MTPVTFDPNKTHAVVFDLGGVLIDWRPRAILELLYPDEPEIRARIMEDVIRHPDWALMDMGALSEQDAAARFARRTALPPSAIMLLFDTVRDMLVPVSGTVRILQDLHDRAVPCFCVSNIPEGNFLHISRRYAFFRLFRGIVVSYKLKMGKPDPRIFRHLLDRHALDPAGTVFIDDGPRNTAAAVRLGMQAILFHNPGQCRSELAARGLF